LATDADPSGSPQQPGQYRPPETAEADAYAEAYAEAGPTPGSVADYRHRARIWVRDRLAALGLADPPAATERPGHAGHPREAMGPAGGQPLGHGVRHRAPAAEADRIERVREGDLGWLGAIRRSATIRSAAISAIAGLGAAVVLLGAAARSVAGLGTAEPSLGSGVVLAVVAVVVGASGARAASRTLCLLGAAIRPDVSDATEAEQRWRCGACKQADRAWADGDRDVTPTVVGEWDIPARLRGEGSTLGRRRPVVADSDAADGDAAASREESHSPEAGGGTVADGGETPIGFAAAVADGEDSHD